MFKLLGLLWLFAIAVYGAVTIHDSAPDLATWFGGIGAFIGIGLLIKWSR